MNIIMTSNKNPRTPFTAGKNHQPLIGFYASDIDKIKLDVQKGGHIYYIINLDTNVIKFGISANWKRRLKDHIANFICYSQARSERLWIVVSRKPIIDLKVGEKLWLYLAQNNSNFIPVGGKEFFVYMKDNLFMLDKFFHSLADLMTGGKGEEVLKKLKNPKKSSKSHKSIEIR